MKEYTEDLLEVLSQEDADKFLDTLKVVEYETAKQIFAYLDKIKWENTVDGIVTNYSIPYNNYKELKKKWIK